MIGKTNKKAYSAIKISKLGSIAAMTQGLRMFSDSYTDMSGGNTMMGMMSF
jgi:hypothetical protein